MRNIIKRAKGKGRRREGCEGVKFIESVRFTGDENEKELPHIKFHFVYDL